MQNKFFLDANYNVKMLSNIQRPFDDIWLWNNLIIFWIDADSTANQYLYVEYGENQTVTLAVEPGEINEIMLNSDYYWTYGGVTHVTPYKNGTALTAKKINITFPDVVENCGTLSSTESDEDGSVILGNDYEMAGSYYVTAETIKDIKEDIAEVEEDVYTIGGEISLIQDSISALDTEVETNTTNIATNTSDIATNTSAISTNTSNIATNTADIQALQGKITISDVDLTAGSSPLATGNVYLVYE